jgi:hypothetical protein
MDLQEILLRSFREGICAKEDKLNNTKLQEGKTVKALVAIKKDTLRKARLSLTRVVQAELYGYCSAKFVQTCKYNNPILEPGMHLQQL